MESTKLAVMSDDDLATRANRTGSFVLWVVLACAMTVLASVDWVAVVHGDSGSIFVAIITTIASLANIYTVIRIFAEVQEAAAELVRRQSPTYQTYRQELLAKAATTSDPAEPSDAAK